MQKEKRQKRAFYMDLQSYTIHKPGRNMFPKPKDNSSVGHYPLALVPGQFTDFYKVIFLLKIFTVIQRLFFDSVLKK